MTAPTLPTMPTKPQERGASTTVSQRDRRWTDTFFDDYRHTRFPNGRPFTGEREFKSGVSEQSVTAGFLQSDLQCGEYFCEDPVRGQTPEERAATLASAWEAPFLLPGGKKYMNFNYARKRITWRYDAFIADERAGLQRFWEAAAKLAGESDIIDPARPDAVPFRIRSLLGSPRIWMNKIRLAQACQAGDPWIMGAVNTPNEELVKLLGFGPVQYFAAPTNLHFGDKDYVAAPAPVAAPPVLTPEQVLAERPDLIAKLVADAVAKLEADKKAANAAKGAKLRAAKDAKKAARETAGATP